MNSFFVEIYNLKQHLICEPRFLGGMERNPYLNRKRTAAVGGFIALSLMTMPTAAAETVGLEATDYVGISFWIATAAMLATTVFFLVERQNVAAKWKTSMSVAALVTGIAWYHYTYMRQHWVDNGSSPIVYRYIDWLLTVPLQIAEFYLILAAIGVASVVMFRNLMVASIVMLVAGFFGETGSWELFGESSYIVWWVIGMAGWVYIIWEIFRGSINEAAKTASESVQFAFNSMRWIVLVGWAIYPLGYMMGNDMISGFDMSDMNIIYNIADLVNKTAFGMMVWYAATMDTKSAEAN